MPNNECKYKDTGGDGCLLWVIIILLVFGNNCRNIDDNSIHPMLKHTQQQQKVIK